MKFRHFVHYVFFVWFLIVLSGCRLAQPENDSSLPSELTQQTYLFEVVRHLYRWHLDESEIEQMVSQKQFVFRLRLLERQLDPGDRSVFAEILLPQLNIGLVVKKADYTIEELATTVQGPGFKIIRITRGNMSDRRLRTGEEVRVDMMQMRDYLFQTRNQQEFPDEQMIERLRHSLRKQIAQENSDMAGLPSTEKVVHLAALSPVANETWVFWEEGRKLFYFASDIDLANPVVWQHETLMSRIFDLDQQVVVSHEEAPGSNRFLTRYQVSRALFNCVVLGRRIVIPPSNADSEASVGKP